MAKAESRGISWEGQILEVWNPHRDPEQIILSSFPNFPSYYWGCTALVPPRILLATGKQEMLKAWSQSSP